MIFLSKVRRLRFKIFPASPKSIDDSGEVENSSR